MSDQERRDWAKWVSRHQSTLGQVPGDRGWNSAAAKGNRAEAARAAKGQGKHRAEGKRGQR